MIVHMVFWNLDRDDKQTVMKKMKNQLDDLRDKITEIKDLKAGVDFNGSGAAFDFGLYTLFETAEDLRIYQDHPDHQKVKEYIGSVVSERAVVDFETS